MKIIFTCNEAFNEAVGSGYVDDFNKRSLVNEFEPILPPTVFIFIEPDFALIIAEFVSFSLLNTNDCDCGC